MVFFQKFGNGLPAEPGEGDTVILSQSQKVPILLLGQAYGDSGFWGHATSQAVSRRVTCCSRVNSMLQCAEDVKFFGTVRLSASTPLVAVLLFTLLDHSSKSFASSPYNRFKRLPKFHYGVVLIEKLLLGLAILLQKGAD